jgi:hypothetical protein
MFHIQILLFPGEWVAIIKGIPPHTVQRQYKCPWPSVDYTYYKRAHNWDRENENNNYSESRLDFWTTERQCEQTMGGMGEINSIQC